MSESQMNAIAIKKHPVFTASLLVTGNVLGVGVLAMPIRTGLGGLLPALIGIITIWVIMLISAFVIASRLRADVDHFDIPSFFHQELGFIGKWLAIICNIILLYGVLIAYLNVIAVLVNKLLATGMSQNVITLSYFCVVSCILLFGLKFLRRSNMVIVFAIWTCFVILVVTGRSDFQPHLLTYSNLKYLPWGLPIAVSAFHFHNIIPSVSRILKHDRRSTFKAISMGLVMGLIINLVWLVIALGTIPEKGAGQNTIIYSAVHGLAANIPMSHILHSPTFTVAGVVFAVLCVTASYVANGTGLFGFMRDMAATYFDTQNRFIVAAISFLPPLIIALAFHRLFLPALDIVGGIGETVLFAILPAIILIRVARNRSKILMGIGCVMLLIGLFVFLFVVAQKIGLVRL